MHRRYAQCEERLYDDGRSGVAYDWSEYDGPDDGLVQALRNCSH
nr:hypothetical protein [Burkholderia sp. S171]